MSQIPDDQRCICNRPEIKDNESKQMDCDASTNPRVGMTTAPDTCSTKVTLVQEVAAHEDCVWCCAWSPNKAILATCSGDKLIKLWARASSDRQFACIQTLDAHTRTVRSVSWHPSGSMFASASFDGSIGIWERARSDGILKRNDMEFECIDLLEGHDNEVRKNEQKCQ